MENYHSGQIKKLSNLNYGTLDNYTYAYFLSNSEILIQNDSSYIFSVETGDLIDAGKRQYIAKNEIVFYRDYLNNQTKLKFYKENKTISFTGFFQTSSNLFDGLIFQRPFNNDWSSENHIYFVNKDATVDTIVDVFPIFDFIDKSEIDSSLLLGKLNSSEQILKIYKYNIKSKTFTSIDSILNYDGYIGTFYTDSILYYTDNNNHYFYNLNTKKKTKLDLCYDYYLNHSTQENIFYFENYGSPPLIYDLKKDKITEIINETYASNVYFTKIVKGDSIYLFDLEYLNLPYYEISYQIKVKKHLNILQDIGPKGIRTSFLNATKDYLYTFEDDDILVLDTTAQNGYRKKKLLNYNSILGTLSGIYWQTYENNLYGVIPIIKGSQKHFDLVKINLVNLEVTNISENNNWFDTLYVCGQGPKIYAINYFPNEFLVYGNRILNLRTEEIFILPETLLTPPFDDVYTASILSNNLILFSDRKILVFSYPDFKYIRSFEMRQLVHITEKFYCFKTEGNSNLIISNGKKFFVLQDTEDYRDVDVNSMKQNDSLMVLINSKTQMLRIYKVQTEPNGDLTVKKEFEDNYTKVSNQTQPKSSNFAAFSFNVNDDKLHTYLINLDSESTFKINGIHSSDIVYFNGNALICIDNKKKQVVKLDLKGNVLDALSYPSGTKFFNNLQKINLGHYGLFVFSRLDMKGNSSKIFFDPITFEFVFDTACKKEYLKYPHILGDNVIYRDNAYFLNVDLENKGRQIFKFKSNSSEGPTSTKNQNIKPLSLHPNPAGDFIGINIENPCDIRSVYIYDLLGYQHKVNYNNCQNQVDVSGLNQGAYFVKIDHLGGFQTLKFLKM